MDLYTGSRLEHGCWGTVFLPCHAQVEPPLSERGWVQEGHPGYLGHARPKFSFRNSEPGPGMGNAAVLPVPLLRAQGVGLPPHRAGGRQE